MRSSSQIRREFLEFFKSQGHAIVPSDSLVPAGDPTLLFTNAGMNQFKKIFLGLETRAYTRAADSQKVLRVSGKHNDLEEVGRDHTHHTFFEMLGNWSFGDYYKEEAIAWAWELLTGVWQLPKDKLYATVFETDDESLNIWKTLTDIGHSRISKHGARDNFWEMGETGPCGPCSEIHMDMGPGACPHEGQAGHACGVNAAGCGRFVEIWNLVFIQYDRQKDEVLRELPSKHVDTGMGFERLVRVLQGAASNYDTDLFRPLIERTEQLSGRKYSPGPEGTSFRVVADHVRALAFTIGDGVVPSNEGRGYVIRRILRRAARHGRLLGLKAPFLHELAGRVVGLMGEAYPDLAARREHIASVIKGEEERFGETLDLGLSLFDEISAVLKGSGATVIAGSEAFKLYDTYGFPLDLTQVMAAERGYTVDTAGFDACMAAQRERARAARGEVCFQACRDVDYPACVFVGYQALSQKTTITGIYRKELELSEAAQGERVDVTLADTPFYGESGGQAGDVGTIQSERGTLKVLGTVKAFNQSTVHSCEVVSGAVKAGDEVTAAVDRQARLATARHHTATHLLQAAMRQVVGKHVQQQGSMVDPSRLRFDFTHGQALDPMQLDQVEELVNAKIMEDLPVGTEHKSQADARAEGAMALFGEKYGDQVRVVSCGDFSRELCGGTHVRRSGEIGLFKILKEEAIASGVRRIEAVAGLPAYRHVRASELLIAEVRDRLKAGRDEIVAKTNALVEQVRTLEKQQHQDKLGRLDATMAELAAHAVDQGGVKYAATVLPGLSPDDLREAGEKLRAKLKDGVGILATASEGKSTIVIAVGDELVAAKKHSAGDIAKQVAAATCGRGGGRPQLAQVGGKDDGRLAETVKKLESIIFG